MKKRSGFTLMELMVSIAVIGITAAIATPNVIAWRNNAQFNAAVRQVKVAIEGARMTAIRSNLQAVVAFTDGANTFDTNAWDRVAGALNLVPKTHRLATDIMVSSNFTGDLLRFNNRGLVIPPTGTITIQNADGLCREIVVSSVGSSRIGQCP